MKTRKETVITLLVMAGLWQVASLFLPEYLMPGIQALWPELVKTLSDPSTYGHIVASMLRIVAAFVFSVVVGVSLGIWMGVSLRIERHVMPALQVLMGIPALSLILVAVIWFRGAELRVFFVIVAIALPIMVLNTLDGIKGIPRELTEMLVSFRPTLWQRVHMITLPGAMPSILVGMKIALSFATRTRGVRRTDWYDARLRLSALQRVPDLQPDCCVRLDHPAGSPAVRAEQPARAAGAVVTALPRTRDDVIYVAEGSRASASARTVSAGCFDIEMLSKNFRTPALSSRDFLSLISLGVPANAKRSIR